MTTWSRNIQKMDREQIKAKIDEVILHKVRDIKGFGDTQLSTIQEHEELFYDFGLNSLDVVEIIIECEGIFNKPVPNDKIDKIFTKNDIYKLFDA